MEWCSVEAQGQLYLLPFATEYDTTFYNYSHKVNEVNAEWRSMSNNMFHIPSKSNGFDEIMSG
jgi:maltose-binding protein MalE